MIEQRKIGTVDFTQIFVSSTDLYPQNMFQIASQEKTTVRDEFGKY